MFSRGGAKTAKTGTLTEGVFKVEKVVAAEGVDEKRFLKAAAEAEAAKAAEIAKEEELASLEFADIQYDAQNDKAIGRVTLLLYLMDTESIEYLPPDVAQPETGKDNVFE
mgnify:CR=1 FL=1